MSAHPISQLDIKTSSSGFYAGFNKTVVLVSKLLVIGLVVWAAIVPEQASNVLSQLMSSMLDVFGAWYMYVMVFYAVVCVALASTPSIGNVILGQADEKPEFSRFSWYAMMFGAGIVLVC